MNDYSPNQNVIVSPYQQNIDILKNFFRKPIILAYAIVSAVVSLISFLSVVLTASNNANSLSYFNAYINNGGIKTTYGLTVPASVIGLIFSVITIVCWIMVYVNSKNSNPAKSPSAPVTVLWVFAIISLVVSCIAAAICLCVMVILLIALAVGQNTYNSYDTYGYYSSSVAIGVAAIIFVLIFLAIALFFLLFYTITNVMFLSSVRKSLNSIYLKKNGAMAYGVLNIIFAVFSIIFAFFALMFYFVSLSSYSTAYLSGNILSASLSLTLSFVIYLMQGIIAISYANYIKSVLNGTNPIVNANVPYSNPVATNPNAFAQYPQQNYNTPVNNNPYNNSAYENPYANPQQINPQEPQSPIPDNSYNQYQQTVEQNPYQQPVQNNPYEQPAAPEVNPIEENSQPVNVTEASAFNEGICPNCGSPVFRSDMFCNNCGTKLK